MLRRPPVSTRTDTLSPYTTLVRSHRFTVGIDVRGSQLFAQVLDAKFAPHPGEVVGGHRVVRVELAAAAVFEMLEPPGYSVPARSEARRVGKECVSTCRSRWSPYH